jgi:cell division protein FtsA
MEKSNEKIKMPNDRIFSLDIGTRTVVGVIGQQDEEKYRVTHYEIMEHPSRAMFDGQIHDIEKVVKVVEKVKIQLEEKSGYLLDQVSIAAAGRALKTQMVSVERNLDYTKTIDKDIIDQIEMEAIQLAQKELEKKLDFSDSRYYCVGYTVSNYYLDSSVITTPMGHRGNQLGIDVIATFLPHIVVDSLYTVMDRVGLEVINLTLEPIAAINIAIPENLRLLNLALVDVGAGTSDIALTKDGTVVSYGMVSKAGDMITENLSREYLLDFDTAENMKVNLSANDTVDFCDIVGIQHNIPSEEVVSRIDETISKLCKSISDTIIEFNGRAPSAVFCIGGGSQIPGFTDKLSEYLELPSERVVMKSTRDLKNIEFDTVPLDGPEYITPVGIGFTALKNRESDFLQILVNEKPIRLFNSKELYVSDALVLVGYNARNLISCRGQALEFYINEEKQSVYGEYGEAAQIYVNGVLANLNTKLKNKDSIYIEQAMPGKAGKAVLKDVVRKNNKVSLNGTDVDLIKDIRVNDEMVDFDYDIDMGDKIFIDKIENLHQLIELYQIETDYMTFKVNGEYKTMDYELNHGDIIETVVAKETVRSNRENDSKDVEMDIVEDLVMESYVYQVVVNGDVIDVKSQEKMIFVDIFNYIDFDRSKSNGILELKLNGNRANYTDALKNGDVIEIGWR